MIDTYLVVDQLLLILLFGLIFSDLVENAFKMLLIFGEGLLRDIRTNAGMLANILLKYRYLLTKLVHLVLDNSLNDPPFSD